MRSALVLTVFGMLASALPACTLLDDPGSVELLQTPRDTGIEPDDSFALDMATDAGELSDMKVHLDGGGDAASNDVGIDASLDSGTDAANDMGRPDCQAQILAANLTVDWTTPKNMYISWDRFNPDLEIREYEVVVGRTKVDVEDNVNVRVITADDAGELRRTTGDFPATWSLIWDLEPDRDYFVKLVAYDMDWCHSESNIAEGRTASDVSNEHVIFSESPTAGFSVPPEVSYSNRNPYAGQFHYEWRADCGEARLCSDIFRRGGFSQPVANFDANAFDTAFLEYAFHNEGTEFVQYPAVRFAVGESGNTEWYKAERKAPSGPSAAYRLYQVPLRLFWREGDRAPLTAAAFDVPIREFGVLVQLPHGSYASWDEVRIRW